MRQHAPALIRSFVPVPVNSQALKGVVLTPAQAIGLTTALEEDAKGAIYSAIISFADALSGLQKGYFSWATIKLYYVCFYIAKAAIARRGYSVFYVGKSPMSLQAAAGASPQSRSGNSHTVVTALYKSSVTNGVLNSQPIDGVHAFDWFACRREDINYRNVRFSDPEVPDWFAYVDSYGVRRVVGEYLTDPTLYAFDSDHSILALPLEALRQESQSRLQFTGLGLVGAEIETLTRLFADKNGPIHHFSFIGSEAK